MPWCKIKQEYEVGDITLLPWNRDTDIEGLDQKDNDSINYILYSYKDIENNPIQNATLAKLNNKYILDDLEYKHIEITRECIELFCFCALSNRNIFSQFYNYNNSDCFISYRQEFIGIPEHIGLAYRRKCGTSIDGRDISEVSFSCPVHVNNIGFIGIDLNFLNSLIKRRSDKKTSDWHRWLSSISCYNMANTDNHAARPQVEWILLCGAFEHLLNAKANNKNVAEKFESSLKIRESLKYRESKRLRRGYSGDDRSLRYEWMKEFYRVRGDFAHGKTSTRQDMSWSTLEHLSLATYAFPLMVKSIMSINNYYELSKKDQKDIQKFEHLANDKFLDNP
jgi:hypothetical protein